MLQSREKTQIIHTQNFINMIQLASFEATPAQIHFLSEEFEKYIIKKPNPILPKEHNRIALYININCVDTTDAAKSTVIEFTDQQNKKKFYVLKQGMMTLADCRQFFIDNNSIIDHTNMRRGNKPKSAEIWRNLQVYHEEESVHVAYALIHQQLSLTVTQFIQTCIQPIEILFIGCGFGNEIKGILQHLENNNIKFIIYGIDRDDKNILTAENTAEFQNKNIFFICGDANDIAHHIENFRLRATKSGISPKTTITIASGFLTREVITPNESFNIFQTIASFSDHIFITGISENLITRKDAKLCGMIIEQRIFPLPFFSSLKKFKTIDHYSFNLNDKIEKIQIDLETQKNQSKKSINLIGFARPIEIIKRLLHKNSQFFNQNKVEIKLQHAYLNMQEMRFIFDLISQNKDNLIISVDGNEKWYKTLHPILLKKNLANHVVINPISYTLSLSATHETSGERHFSNNFSKRILQTYTLGNNSSDIVSFFKIFPQINKSDLKTVMIPLAIENKNFQLIEFLVNQIKNDLDWNIENSQGETLAYLFIRKAVEIESVSLLSDKDAKLSVQQINAVLATMNESNVNLEKVALQAKNDVSVLKIIEKIRTHDNPKKGLT